VIVTAPDTNLPAEKLGRVHFVGIGGAGMSGIARIMASRGIEVSGSDAKDGTVLAALRALGATCWVGHAAEQVAEADTVVVSTAIRETNPEVVAAREAGIPILPRAAALASVMVGRRTLAVAGTHGKTTTTSMLTVALQHCGVDPSYAIGGNLNESGSNAHDGNGDPRCRSSRRWSRTTWTTTATRPATGSPSRSSATASCPAASW
jgi:UDP-N-acetylmuramate--alanine ligase